MFILVFKRKIALEIQFAWKEIDFGNFCLGKKTFEKETVFKPFQFYQNRFVKGYWLWKEFSHMGHELLSLKSVCLGKLPWAECPPNQDTRVQTVRFSVGTIFFYFGKIIVGQNFS